eukprot:NODE_1944_length_407_cov_78.157143_g1934_i0.p1 GENE.NODE_1944_length_407_cov_78.157143_g1934_i0~~NODE_1944_length_407_cov_78.157143_g1934_i0.p1  ORF type:complete len:104 (+),score=14.21 NODE_1944_length_407_cov_78.157143_g1934_i0:66-377(+)
MGRAPVVCCECMVCCILQLLLMSHNDGKGESALPHHGVGHWPVVTVQSMWKFSWTSTPTVLVNKTPPSWAVDRTCLRTQATHPHKTPANRPGFPTKRVKPQKK